MIGSQPTGGGRCDNGKPTKLSSLRDAVGSETPTPNNGEEAWGPFRRKLSTPATGREADLEKVHLRVLRYSFGNGSSRHQNRIFSDNRFLG